MMLFPFRLRADLLRARLDSRVRGKRARPLIFCLNPGTSNPTPGAANAESSLLASAQSSSAPIVWIGGGEPLDTPAIGTLARRICDSGRTVFLETNGILLRRRIHEFRPVSRLFVTVKFHGLEAEHDLRSGRAGTFRAAIEGIRAAKLSGFLICAHALLDATTRLEDVTELKGYLAALDADGFLISAAPQPASASSTGDEILRKKVLEARNLITSPGWQRFSRILDTHVHELVPAPPKSPQSAQHVPSATPPKSAAVHPPKSPQESMPVS